MNLCCRKIFHKFCLVLPPKDPHSAPHFWVLLRALLFPRTIPGSRTTRATTHSWLSHQHSFLRFHPNITPRRVNVPRVYLVEPPLMSLCRPLKLQFRHSQSCHLLLSHITMFSHRDPIHRNADRPRLPPM